MRSNNAISINNQTFFFYFYQFFIYSLPPPPPGWSHEYHDYLFFEKREFLLVRYKICILFDGNLLALLYWLVASTVSVNFGFFDWTLAFLRLYLFVVVDYLLAYLLPVRLASCIRVDFPNGQVQTFWFSLNFRVRAAQSVLTDKNRSKAHDRHSLLGNRHALIALALHCPTQSLHYSVWESNNYWIIIGYTSLDPTADRLDKLESRFLAGNAKRWLFHILDFRRFSRFSAKLWITLCHRVYDHTLCGVRMRGWSTAIVSVMVIGKKYTQSFWCGKRSTESCQKTGIWNKK